MFTSDAHAAGYAAGIIDGEGSVGFGPNQRNIRVGNTDIAIIEAYEHALEQLGIYSRRTARRPEPNRKQMFTVTIYGRRDLELVRALVPIRAPDKLRRLDEAIASFVLPSYHRKGEVTRERLEELVALGLSQRGIAAALGLAGQGSAQYHLEKHGLRTRYSTNPPGPPRQSRGRADCGRGRA